MNKNNRLLLSAISAVMAFSVCLPVASIAQDKPVVHTVTDLAHEFTFYADHRFDTQYLPAQKGETNWCNLYNFDFPNANLLILPGCDDRSALTFDQPKNWKVLIHDSGDPAVMAMKKVGKGILLVSSRSLAGSNPNAKDSINKEFLISHWLSTRYTVEFMGLWESMNNPHFNVTEFDTIKSEV